MPHTVVSRRALLGGALVCAFAPRLNAAAPFWDRKPATAWTPEEITQLLTRSPWARETNIDFEQTEGGHVEVPVGGGATGQEGVGRGAADGKDPTAGVMRRAPVEVRWESSQAIRDAAQLPLAQIFAGRYVISVSNIPPEIMRRSRNVAGMTYDDLMNELQGAATLESPGREPAGAGLVKRVPGTENGYLFGFDKELMPLTGNEKEIDFVLRTARVSVKAKFEPKNMVYRGKPAL